MAKKKAKKQRKDKQSELLANPNRCGYGENTTGGTNLVEVSNEQEFFDAISISGNYVCLTSALANTTIVRGTTFTSSASNITIDGSLAPGFKVAVGAGMSTDGFLFRLLGNNIIIHDIEATGLGQTITTNNHSCFNMEGENIWIDKVTGSEFDDDFINILLDADNITVSRIKTYNTSKSVFVYNPDPGQEDTKLTVHSSDLASDQRSPHSSAGFTDVFNNWIHGGGEGSLAGRDAAWSGFPHTGQSLMITRNNVYENQTFHSLRGFDDVTATQGNEGFIESIGDQLDGGIAQGNVTFNTTPTLFNIPYDCSDIFIDDVSQVKSYVQSVAGSN